MSVCLALAVIYSTSYSGSSAPTLEANGSIIAKGVGSVSDTDQPPTGIVGEQVLELPYVESPFGQTDSLKPGQDIPEKPWSADDILGRDKTDANFPAAQGTMERPGKGMLIAPLQFLSTSSLFGHRTSPITGEIGEFHTGHDWAAPCGTRVFSADAGVVRAVGWHPWGGGNRVELDHGNGLVTTYNHLEGIAVEKGDNVGAGQVIAAVGTSGMSTGCHLHFETILNGEHTDPAAWKLIPLDGSGPIDMPALVNFGPGGDSGGDTAWRAYLASGGELEPMAAPPSPSRVDAATAEPKDDKPAETRPSDKPSSKPSSSPSASPSEKPKPSPKPSPDGKPTTKPPATSEPTDPPKTSEPTKPPTDPSPDPSPTPDPTPTPDPMPTPTPDPDPSPTPDPDPSPTPDPSPDPTPSPTPDPSPTPAPDPSPTPDPTPPPTPTPTPTPPPTTQPPATPALPEGMDYCAPGADLTFGTGDEIIGEAALQDPERVVVVPISTIISTTLDDGTVTNQCAPLPEQPAAEATATTEPLREPEPAVAGTTGP
ncbi:hypothetical protein GCM10027403_08810 [Arthrobacter tecti]